MSVELNAYLFFPGNTEQAVAFYQQVFGGQVSISRRGEIDPTASPQQKNKVINALLTGGDITLRASDREDTSTDPQTRRPASNCRLSVPMRSGCGHCSTVSPKAARSGPSWSGNSGVTSLALSPTSTASAGRSTSEPLAPDTLAPWVPIVRLRRTGPPNKPP